MAVVGMYCNVFTNQGFIRVVARIFVWKGPNHKSRAIASAKIFEIREFLRVEDAVEWKIKS